MPEFFGQIIVAAAGGVVAGVFSAGMMIAELKALRETVKDAHKRLDDHINMHHAK